MGDNIPLDRFSRFASNDLDAVRDYVSGLFCSHQLGLTDRTAQINTRLHHMEMTNLSFVYLDYGAPVSIKPGCLQDFYLLQIVLEGRASVSNGHRTYTATGGEATLINPNEPIQIISSAECRFLSIRLNKRLVNQQLAVSLHDTPGEPLSFEPELNFNIGNGRAIRRYIKFLVDELNFLAEHRADISATYQCFEQTLAAMLIELHTSNYSQKLADIKPPQGKPYVKEAEQFMEENLSRQITLQDLALAAKTTPRTLRNAFHHCYGTSPMCYLKTMRLDHAHRRLTTAASGANITNIAMDCGFRHLGRFSKEYKERFGETPSQTLGK